MIMKVACLCLGVFLISAGLTYATRRYRERRPEDGAGINECCRNSRLKNIMVNPKLDFEDLKNLELLLEPNQNGSYNAKFVASEEDKVHSLKHQAATTSILGLLTCQALVIIVTEVEVCTSFDWLYEVISEEGDRAVYSFAGPIPDTGEGASVAHFNRNPDNYVFMLHCLDRTKEIVRNGKRVYCDGPYNIIFLTLDFPPDRVRWCEAEAELMKTFGVTFDNEFWLFNPILERCSS